MILGHLSRYYICGHLNQYIKWSWIKRDR